MVVKFLLENNVMYSSLRRGIQAICRDMNKISPDLDGFLNYNIYLVCNKMNS